MITIDKRTLIERRTTMQTSKKTITDNKQESFAEAVEVEIAEEAKMSEPAHVETEKATEPADAAKPRKKAGKIRRIIGDSLIGITVAFTVYLCAGMLYRIHTVANPFFYWKVFWNEMVIFGILTLLTVDLRTGFLTKLRAIPFKVIGWCARIAACVVAGAVLAVAGSVIGKGMIRTASSADYVIALGMALENGKPTQDLLYRVKTAEDYAAKHPEVTLIVTGGNQSETALSEAEVMKQLLISDGIDESRIITEDQAQSTQQNFENVAKMIDPTKPVVIVTNNYHMDRAVKIAQKAGFTTVERLPALSDPVFYGVNIMWEVMNDLDSAINWNKKKPYGLPSNRNGLVSTSDQTPEIKR